MVKRLLLVSGLVIGLVVAADSAGAQQYPPTTAGPTPAQPAAVVSPAPAARAAVAPTPAATTVTAGAQPTGAAGGLPTTGDDLAVPLLRMGAVLLALGGLLVFVTRSRRASTVAT